MKPQMRQSLHSFRSQKVHIYLTTDKRSDSILWEEPVKHHNCEISFKLVHALNCHQDGNFGLFQELTRD